MQLKCYVTLSPPSQDAPGDQAGGDASSLESKRSLSNRQRDERSTKAIENMAGRLVDGAKAWNIDFNQLELKAKTVISGFGSTTDQISPGVFAESIVTTNARVILTATPLAGDTGVAKF